MYFIKPVKTQEKVAKIAEPKESEEAQECDDEKEDGAIIESKLESNEDPKSPLNGKNAFTLSAFTY